VLKLILESIGSPLFYRTEQLDAIFRMPRPTEVYYVKEETASLLNVSAFVIATSDLAVTGFWQIDPSFRPLK